MFRRALLTLLTVANLCSEGQCLRKEIINSISCYNYFDPKSLSANDLEEAILESKIQGIDPIDYLFSGNEQVIIFGEDHSNILQKEYFAKNLSKMKAKGVTTIALEMFSEDEQNILDKYLEGDSNKKKQILNILKKYWNKGEGTVESYMNLVDAIKKENMRILALDVSIDILSKNLSRDERLKLNDKWVDKIKEYIENSDARLVVYCGLGHCIYENSLVNLLKGKNISSLDAVFCGGSLPREVIFDSLGNIIYSKVLLTFEEMRLVTERIDWVTKNKGIDYEFLLKPKPEYTMYDQVPSYYLWIPGKLKD